MVAMFKHTLSGYRGAILGWGLALVALGVMMIGFYDSISKPEQLDMLQGLVEIYPPEIMAFFGDINTMATPEGFLSLEYFTLMPIMLGIFAVSTGAAMLAKDEEEGILDIILAHPISRASLFTGRLLAFLTATCLIEFIAWLGIVLPVSFGISSMKLSYLGIMYPYISLFGIVLLFGSLALFFSMVLPSRRAASMLSGFLLVAGYFITSLGKIVPELENAARFSPYSYYQSGDAIHGLNTDWTLGLIGISVIFVVLALVVFLKRDIRVAGEGGWRLFRFQLRKSPRHMTS